MHTRLLVAALLLVTLGCGHEGTYTCLRNEARVGDACSFELPCVEGASCVDGACRIAPGPGEACGTGNECAYGYECYVGTCVSPMSPEGRACDPEVIGACAPGLACLPTGFGWACLGPAEEGEACRDDRQCEEGLRCRLLSSTVGGGRACAAPPVGEEDLCAGDDECPTDHRCVREELGEMALCAPDLGDGERCSTDGYGAACGAGLTCTENGACRRILGEAEPCGGPLGVCGDGLHCQPSGAFGAQVCLPPVADGASCRNGAICSEGASCDRDRPGQRFPTSFSLAPTR